MQSTFDAIVHVHRLPEHFAWEERPGGYFAGLERIHADGARLVANLVEEHRQMLAALPVLMEAGDDLVPRARRFAAWLAAHEQREARLGPGLDEVGL